MDDQWLRDDVLHPVTGIEGGKRILENDLHIAPEAAHFTGTGGEQVAAFEMNIAGGGFNQAQDQATQRALSRSGFSHQAEGLARLDVERDVIDRADVAREDLDEVSDFEQWHDAMLAVTSTALRAPAYREEKGLSRGDQRYRCQCGQQSDELPAAEMFLQNDPCQQHCDGRVKGRNHYRFVETAVLAG